MVTSQNGFPEGFVVNYKNFLKMAKDIFEIAEKDKLYDLDGKELKKADISNGFFLAMNLGNNQYIGTKIAIGTKEELKEVFKE